MADKREDGLREGMSTSEDLIQLNTEDSSPDKNVEMTDKTDTDNEVGSEADREAKPGIFKSFIDYFYGNFIVLVLGFVSLPVITRVLSTEEYGRTSLYSSVVSIIYIFAILGLDQSYIRYYYKEGVSRRKLFRQCLSAPLVLIVVLAGIYAVFARPLNLLLFDRHGIDITLLVVAYTVTSVFERFLFLNIRMDQKGKLYSNLNILSKVLYIAFIFIFVYILGDDFRVGLYALTLPLVLVTLGIGIGYAVRIHGESMDDHKISTKELLKYGVPFVPMLLMEWLLSSMDKWSIKIFNDYAETGVYSAAMQIMTILLTFKITYVAFWSPVAMEKYETGTEAEVKPFFADMFEKVQFLCMLAAFGLTAFRSIIVLILGESYRGAIRIIPFLSLMPILSILFEMTGQGIKFKGKVIYFNYASLAAIVCNLAGNTLLVPKYKGVGAAFATALTYIVYFAIGTYLANRCYPVQYKYGRFVTALVIYIGYSFYATLCGTEWVNIVLGIVLMVVLCALNAKTLTALWKLASDALRSFKRNNQ